MEYKPLSIKYREHYVREKRSLFELDETKFRFSFVRSFLKAWRKLDSYIPFVCLYPVLYSCDEQRQVYRQLEDRQEFATDQWNNIGFDCKEIKNILTFIKEQFLWPNINYIPDDPLYCLFLSFDCNDVFWVVEDINDNYGKKILSIKEVHEMIQTNKTIGDLIILIKNQL